MNQPVLIAALLYMANYSMYRCPAGAPFCVDGACVNTTTPINVHRCQDLDTGKNLGERGYTKSYLNDALISTERDECIDDRNLLEYYCAPNSPMPVVSSSVFTCPTELPICYDGRCMNSTTLDEVLEDEVPF